MTTVSIDPGKRHIGYALWDGSTMLEAGLVRGPIRTGGDDVDVVAQTALAAAHAINLAVISHGCPPLIEMWCERPQVYTTAKQVKEDRRTDPNDLPPLFGCDAALAVALGLRVRSCLPHEWKGSLTKPQGNARAYEALTPEERTHFDPDIPADKMHDVLDAVGIGEHFLGRFPGRVRVYRRA